MPDAVTAQTSWSVISSDSGGNLYSSMVGLSDHHVEVLIELVRSRPVLWQKSHPDYKNTRRIKANNWEDVIGCNRLIGCTQYLLAFFELLSAYWSRSLFFSRSNRLRLLSMVGVVEKWKEPEQEIHRHAGLNQNNYLIGYWEKSRSHNSQSQISRRKIHRQCSLH